MQKYLQNFQKLNFYLIENLQILFKGICAKKWATFLRKSYAIYFDFQRAITSQNAISGSSSKYRFSRVKAFRQYAL